MVASSYGYLALLMQAVRNENTISPIEDSEQIYKSLELNLRIKPEDSYIFDGLTLSEAESWLNNATFYSELIYNIQLEKFLKERDLADSFDSEREEDAGEGALLRSLERINNPLR